MPAYFVTKVGIGKMAGFKIIKKMILFFLGIKFVEIF